MKKLITIIPALFLAASLSAQTIAVYEFESDIFCLESQTGVMSDLFVDELVNIQGIKIVERDRIAAILREKEFQNQGYTNAETVIEEGQMLNADCIIYGKTTFIDNSLVVTARLADVKTGQILYTAKMQCKTWKEFYQKLPKFALECVNKIPSPNRFIGNWICNSESSTYDITFKENKKCEIKISSSESIAAETALSGTYSYSTDSYSGGKILKINAKSKDGKTKISWSNIYTFTSDDFSSFNMQIKNAENKTVRASFVKVE